MKSFCGVLLFTIPLCAAQPGNVSISYGAKGLSAINYNGFQYLSYGNFGVNGVNFVNAAGQVSPGNTSGTAVYDSARLQTTLTFNWGKVTAGYAVSGNRLNVTITTSNTSSLTVQGLFYEPFGLVFPATPREFDGVNPMVAINNGNPTALRMTAGASALVLANDDVVQPLLVGFPWSVNKPASTVFPVKVETSQDSMLPNSIPFVNRPIAPGASDTYHLSLRFGPASASTKSLAADVYQTFATVYPFTVNWPDRRPIGQLILGSTATGFPTNPRGWFNDPSVDVTTSPGVAAFQARVLGWAQNAVTILKSMNAQGMVTWDIEGEQFPQPTTYIGDPTLFGTLAPEMNGVVDRYFKTFTDAGLRVGICIRPQQLANPGGGAPTQTTVADPTQLLLKKVAYANKRWGATLFYIDSNGDPNFPISSTFFQTVAAKFPKVLLIPEHQTTSYFGFGSWYGELRGGFHGTPPAILDVYPSAFSVIYLPDGNFSQNQTLLQASADRGDIMMFRAWYTDPQNGEILTLYPTGGVAPPTPIVATPVNNSTVNGMLAVTASVEPGPAGITGVQYLLDGASVGSPVAAAPFRQTIDTAALTGGLHQLQAVATDAAGDRGFAASNFFVSASGENPAPLVSFVTPADGSRVEGDVLIQAAVTDPTPIVTAQFQLDGANLGPALTAAPYQVSWSSSLAGGGTHLLGITVTDQAGQTGQATESVTVVNEPLSVQITAPASGAVVSRTATLAASASGSAGVAGVQFTVDGSNVGGQVTSAPYAVNWDSSLVTDGAHTLQAIAFDGNGGSATASLPVTVRNLPGAGFLNRSTITPTGTQDLTSSGGADWAHWGLGDGMTPDRKGSVAPAISGSAIGSAPVTAYGNNPCSYSWSDGAPLRQQAGTSSGVFVVGHGNGFQITAAADTSAKILTIYTGVYKAQARVTVQLSDGSAPAYTDDSSVVNFQGQLSVAYVVSYRAASPGQTVTVTVTQEAGSGDSWSNVTLQAAALSIPGTGALSGTVSLPAGTQDLTSLGSADWIDWNGVGSPPYNRKTGVLAPMLGNLTPVGTAKAHSYSNNPFGFSWTDGSPVANMTSTKTGEYSIGEGTGFALTAPADTNWRTVTVFAGVYKAQGRLTAALSDGSAPVFTDDSVSSASGQLSAAYTLRYRAQSEGQTLAIVYTQANAGSDPSSNVTMQAATLALQ